MSHYCEFSDVKIAERMDYLDKKFFFFKKILLCAKWHFQKWDSFVIMKDYQWEMERLTN